MIIFHLPLERGSLSACKRLSGTKYILRNMVLFYLFRKIKLFLFLSFRRVLNVIFSFLGNFQASEF